jgi:hypothetical protein
VYTTSDGAQGDVIPGLAGFSLHVAEKHDREERFLLVVEIRIVKSQ